jgi:thiol:disulfide interchange protein
MLQSIQSQLSVVKATFTLPALAIVAAGALLLAASPTHGLARQQTPQQAAPSDDEQEMPKVIGVLFYADWCGSCKVLDPKLEAVEGQLGQKPIVFQRFDMTDEATTYRSKLLANLLGLAEVFERNAGKTGFMLLIDPQTKQVVGRLTKDQSKEELAAEIRRVIGE